MATSSIKEIVYGMAKQDDIQGEVALPYLLGILSKPACY